MPIPWVPPMRLFAHFYFLDNGPLEPGQDGEDENGLQLEKDRSIFFNEESIKTDDGLFSLLQNHSISFSCCPTSISAGMRPNT